MLHGISNSEPTILALLHSAPFDFHLTGSRFFETENSFSDWDFFAQDSPETRDWLRRNDFTYVSNEDIVADYMNDLNCADVFQRGNVQVQLVKDAHAKMHVQTLIKKRTLVSLVSKRDPSRRNLWNAMFEAFQAGRKDAGGLTSM